MKAFVTGATGFVGSHIAESLIEAGYDVAALVRAPQRKSWLDAIPPVQKIEGDLADRRALRAGAEGADLIVHAAGLVKARSEREYLEANAAGTRNVLAAALAGGGSVKRFVYISSQAAAGPACDGRPTDEASPPRPITPYGRSKLAGEEAVLARKEELPVTLIRPPAVYGPRDKEIFIYFRMASRGFVPVVGPPRRRVSLAYAKDLANATVAAAQSARTIGETYFVSSGDHDWNELSAAVAEAVGRGRRIPIPAFVLIAAAWTGETLGRLSGRRAILDHHKAREILQDSWVCSSQRASEHFEYRPAWDLKRGMADTVAWYRKEGWLS